VLKFFEAFTKQNYAGTKKINPGIIGNITPIIPITKKNNPNTK